MLRNGTGSLLNDWAAPRTISVVINTCNRANSLRKTIEALLHEADERVEIIVVNGPSTDHTDEVISDFRDKIKALKCDAFNLSVSRNIGIAAASGEVIAFIDDDAFPEPYWIDRLLAAYDSEDVGAVGGHVFDHTGIDFQCTYIICDRFGSAWPKETNDPSNLYSFPRAFRFSALIGTNCSFRRDVLLRVGGFDEEYEYFLDETDVCVRVVDAGYRIIQRADAYVHHKFLPSHMRNATKATVHHYPILKNTLYFALKYASPYVGVEAALTHGENVYAAHLRDAKWFVEHGELPPAKLRDLPGVYARAQADALARYQQGTSKHLSKDTLATFSSDFLPVTPLLPVSDRLGIVLLCRQYDAVDSGIARFVRDQAEALSQLGHNVHVLTLTQGESTVDWEAGVWVHRLKAGWYTDQDESLPCRINESQWCYSRTMLDEVRRISRRHPIDIVEAPIWDNESIAFAHTSEFPLVVSLQTSMAIALESHPEWRENNELMRTYVLPSITTENYILERCDGVRGISSAIVEEIEQRNGIAIDRAKVHICPLGFKDRYKAAFSAQRRTSSSVYFLGRLELRKGIDTLLEAIPRVLQVVPDAQFYIAGDNSIAMPGSSHTFQSHFEKEHPELLTSVHFLGRIDDKRADQLFAESSVFVAPSRFESFGIIYVEAMMFGTPIVATRVGGIPEVVGNGEAAVLIASEDSTELSDALVRLLTRCEEARKLGENGRRLYDLRYTPAAASDKLLRSYADVLGKKRKQGSIGRMNSSAAA